MSITDFSNESLEVRIRQGAMFQQIPNLIEAGADLADGMFVRLVGNAYAKASAAYPATHLVLKSGEPRLTASEIESVGFVHEGEPVIAITGGPGTVTIPIAESVTAGDELTVGDEGYAVKKVLGVDAFVVGIAAEDATLPPGDSVIFANALVTLPAQFRTTPEEEA